MNPGANEHRFLPLLALLTSLAMLGCVSPSPQTDLDVSPLPVGQAIKADAGGEIVRWGGTIASVANTQSGTVLQVVSRPLSTNGRPVRNDKTDGRFLARVDEFLDPEIFKQGKDVTVVGEFAETEQGTIGEMDYRFPVLHVKHLKMWRPVQNNTIPPYGFHHDHFWHDWPYHHHYRKPRTIDNVQGRFVF